MKIALSTVCMPELPRAEAFAEAAGAGFSDVELLAIPGWVHVEAGTVAPGAILDEAKRVGVKLIGVHAGGIDGSSDDALDASVAYIEKALDLAAGLGAKLLVFTGAGTPDGTDAGARAGILDRISGGLARLAPELDRRDVRLGLENHYRCQIDSLDDYRAVFGALGDCPSIGATVDTGHFTASGIDSEEVVRELGKRVYHVHVKDHVGTESVGLGRGKTDNAAVARALREAGYDGYLSAELEVEDRENAITYVREAKPYLERMATGKL